MTRNNSERVFLRDSETGEFYKSPDAWVSNLQEATAFETRDHALLQRLSIPKSKLDMLVLDERGRPLAGIKLWSCGSGSASDFPLH